MVNRFKLMALGKVDEDALQNVQSQVNQVDEDALQKVQSQVNLVVEEAYDNDVIKKEEYETMEADEKKTAKFQNTLKVH